MKSEDQVVKLAIEAARKAGELLRRKQDQEEMRRVVGRGMGGDATLKADREAEEAVLRVVKGLGDCEVITEEAGRLTFGQPRWRWIIDPLDGSTNYARGLSHFAVSILIERLPSLEKITAVVYEPSAEKCFQAVHCEGSYLNGRRIHVRTERKLEDCLFALDMHFGGQREKIQEFTKRLERLSGHIKTFRTLGSNALALTRTASGELDGFMDLSHNTRFLDVAAGIMILQEAGGLATDMKGGTVTEEYENLIACANPAIHKQITKILE